MSKILIIQGHPDPAPERLDRALARAYAEAAQAAGHDVRLIDVASLDFPMLRSKQDWETGTPPPVIAQAQQDVRWAEHLAVFFPLWMGSTPALLKGFFEQVFRPGFALDSAGGKGWKKRLSGKSARLVVTMGMPGLVYRWYFGAHGLKSLKRNLLGFCGIRPIHDSLLGLVDAKGGARHQHWLERMRELGAAAR